MKNGNRDKMICRIAELLVDVPAAGGLTPRCADYIEENEKTPDIVISEELYKPERYEGLSDSDIEYLESGFQFYCKLLHFGGMMLHASAVEYGGYAYVFSGPCGMGKSTHTRLWQKEFGESVRVFNDDKPAIRRVEGKWYAYGTPWCGKDGININLKAPLGGICFLRRGEENRIRRVDGLEAAQYVMSQTLRRFKHEESFDLMISNINALIKEVPIFEFKNLPIPESARLSYETMYSAAKEMHL